MTSFLKIRVIVDSQKIYEIKAGKSLLIEVDRKVVMLQATDGYHSSKPLQLRFKKPSYYHIKVECALSDSEIYFSLSALILFYLSAIISGIFLFKIGSFLPLMYLMIRYLANRKEFLKIMPA